MDGFVLFFVVDAEVDRCAARGLRDAITLEPACVDSDVPPLATTSPFLGAALATSTPAAEDAIFGAATAVDVEEDDVAVRDAVVLAAPVPAALTPPATAAAGGDGAFVAGVVEGAIDGPKRSATLGCARPATETFLYLKLRTQSDALRST